MTLKEKVFLTGHADAHLCCSTSHSGQSRRTPQPRDLSQPGKHLKNKQTKRCISFWFWKKIKCEWVLNRSQNQEVSPEGKLHENKNGLHYSPLGPRPRTFGCPMNTGVQLTEILFPFSLSFWLLSLSLPLLIYQIQNWDRAGRGSAAINRHEV